jgi:hypothetical protein
MCPFLTSPLGEIFCKKTASVEVLFYFKIN